MNWARMDYRPFAKLAALRDQLAKSAAVDIGMTPNGIETAEQTTTVPEFARPCVSGEVTTVITEDLPGRWIEEMLFNPGAVSSVWSELDALREAAWKNPPPSPHPLQLRKYGRIDRSDCGDRDGNYQGRRAA